MQGLRPGGPAPCYVDPARRAALLGLLDHGFPGIAAGIERAAAEGFDWGAVTEPFVEWEGEAAVAHVGVLEHRLRLAGEDVVVAGVHAVVTREDRRRRGLARRTLSAALDWADRRSALAKLGTDLPEVYARHGFRRILLHRFELDHEGGEDRGRPLRPDERGWFLELCARRVPVSERFDSLDPGWLIGLDLALGGRSLDALVVLDALGAVVEWSVRDRVLHLHALISDAPVPLDAVLRLAPPHDGVALHLCPDRLAPTARPVPMPEAGVWMLRGAWPLGEDAPIAISRLAQH